MQLCEALARLAAEAEEARKRAELAADLDNGVSFSFIHWWQSTLLYLQQSSPCFMSFGEKCDLECACQDVMRMRGCVLSVWIATPIMPFFLAVTGNAISEIHKWLVGEVARWRDSGSARMKKPGRSRESRVKLVLCGCYLIDYHKYTYLTSQK
jgi:hypothetical protein